MSFTLPIGSKTPNFSLMGTDGKMHTLESLPKTKALVIFFTCNHCPYVINSDEHTRKIADAFSKKGVQFIGINANSKNTYKEDSFEKMVERMKEHNFPWLYLHDETQEVAKAFGALRTPHFFLFDENQSLIYCGRSVDSPRDLSKAKTADLELALTELLSKKPLTTPLTNPVGCNVKWEGKEKHWMPPEACDLVP